MNVDVPEALRLLDRTWYRFSRSCEKASPTEMSALFQALQTRTSPGALFLRVALDPDDLAGTWKPALIALKSFRAQYSWGSKQRRKFVADVAARPRLLAATQAAASSADAPLEMLAVLAFEGSEASADALLPHFHEAVKKADALARFEDLRDYLADTRWTRALLGALDAKAQEFRARAPVHQLAERLGIASGPRFRVELLIDGLPLGKGARARAHLRLDSLEDAPILWVNPRADRVAGKNVVVPTTLDALPTALAQWAKKLKVRWNFEAHAAYYLRGKRLTRFIDWLNSG